MTKGTNFRLYTFINFYLSSIQQGIQTAHIVSEIFSKYKNPNDQNLTEYQALYQWASKDKTIVVLNGGTSFDIRQDYIKISSIAEQLLKLSRYETGGKWFLPHAFFTEDFNALGAYDNGVVTGFGIIIPEEIWGAQPVPQPEIGWAVNHDPLIHNLYYQFNKIGEGNKIISSTKFFEGEPDTELISIIRSKSLAR